VGLDNGSLSPDKFLKRGKSHYHEMRFRAVRYAHRALAVVGQDPEEQARVLATVAMTLGLVGMDYHAVLAELASLQLIDDKKQQLKRDVETKKFEPPAALEALREDVCKRMYEIRYPAGRMAMKEGLWRDKLYGA